MARKRAPAKTPGKKRGSRKPKEEQGSSIGIVLVILMLMVVGLAWYFKNGATLPEFLQASSSNEEVVPSTDSAPVATQPALRKEQTDKKTEPKIQPEFTAASGPSAAEERSAALKEEEVPADYNRYYYTSSFDFSWPAYGQDDLVVEHEGYTLAYDEGIEQAKWVAYTLTASNLGKKTGKRKDNFRSDTFVRTASADPDDYRNSGFDRGHLAAAADFSWSQEAIDGTFFMSNMSPQVPAFNRGVWKKLEEKVRGWGVVDKELFIVTGPIVERGAKRIGKNKVAVPQKFYKIVLDLSEPEVKAIGFILKNEGSSKDFMEFAVTIDSIEKITGLDFFPMVPDDLENELEGAINKSLWK